MRENNPPKEAYSVELVPCDQAALKKYLDDQTAKGWELVQVMLLPMQQHALNPQGKILQSSGVQPFFCVIMKRDPGTGMAETVST